MSQRGKIKTKECPIGLATWSKVTAGLIVLILLQAAGKKV